MSRISTKGLSIWGKMGVRLCPVITARLSGTRTKTLEVLAQARELGDLSMLRKGSQASIDKLRQRIIMHKNNSPTAVINTWGKIEYDALTRSIIEKIGTDGYDDVQLTSLINFETGQLHLMEDVSHERLAQEYGLQESKTSLKLNWYGFNLKCLGPITLDISPMSGQFGGIPIKFAPVFEKYIRGLSESISKIGFVRIYQFNYQREIPLEKLALVRQDYNLVSRSLSDSELIERFPFLG